MCFWNLGKIKTAKPKKKYNTAQVLQKKPNKQHSEHWQKRYLLHGTHNKENDHNNQNNINSATKRETLFHIYGSINSISSWKPGGKWKTLVRWRCTRSQNMQHQK